jgi:phage anti-repressor protein
MKNQNKITQQSHNVNQPEQSARMLPPIDEILRVSASDLQLLVGDQSSYQDFCDIEIARILSRTSLKHYSYELGESGQRYFCPGLAYIIVRSQIGFTNLMASILFEEAMEGMHSAASLTLQTRELIDLSHGSNLQVDARGLHRLLGVKQPFSLWIAQGIKGLKLMEGHDYWRVARNVREIMRPNQLPRCGCEVSVSTEIATDMAMTARSPRGNRVRRYYIGQSNLLEPDPIKSWKHFMKAMNGDTHKPAGSLG